MGLVINYGEGEGRGYKTSKVLPLRKGGGGEVSHAEGGGGGGRKKFPPFKGGGGGGDAKKCWTRNFPVL